MKVKRLNCSCTTADVTCLVGGFHVVVLKKLDGLPQHNVHDISRKIRYRIRCLLVNGHHSMCTCNSPLS